MSEIRNSIKSKYQALGIREDVYREGEAVLSKLEARFREIDSVAEYNQLKVLEAFRKNQVSEACLRLR